MNKLNSTQAIESFIQKCREEGFRVTPQRLVIYKELLKATDHPTIEGILKKERVTFPNVSFDTVYRTVLSFVDKGIIHMVEGYGGSKRFDPDTRQHHHFRCARCQKIEDFNNESFDNIKIPEEISKQFNITQKRVVLEGVCAECSKEE